MHRAQYPIPSTGESALREIPKNFVDDGCSNSPDGWFGFEFQWACRIHDYRYCTRCHDPGTMTYGMKLFADNELKRNIRYSLPWRWRWVRYVYHAGVWFGGNFSAWDSCGPDAGEVCRHGMSQPDWM
jgi:hypothetical protein